MTSPNGMARRRRFGCPEVNCFEIVSKFLRQSGMVRTSPPRPPAAPPATAAEGAAHVRAFMLGLFARNDGEAVDRRLIAETLFRAAFDALDKLPVEVCRKVAARAHEGSYQRMTDGPKPDSAASKTGPRESELTPSNTGVLKSSPAGPRN